MTTNNQSINKTAEMTKMALMVAMNCISAYIIIPLPFSLSPIALQTLIVNLTGYVLNVKQAFMTLLVSYSLVLTSGWAWKWRLGPASCLDPQAVTSLASSSQQCSWLPPVVKNTTLSVMRFWAALLVSL